MDPSASKEISIEFVLESQFKESIKCSINEKISSLFEAYSKKIGIDLSSYYFLYNGVLITDFEKTFEQIANKDDKVNMKMTILVYKVNEDNDKINV